MTRATILTKPPPPIAEIITHQYFLIETHGQIVGNVRPSKSSKNGKIRRIKPLVRDRCATDAKLSLRHRLKY
jgi:hypothetical protein